MQNSRRPIANSRGDEAALAVQTMQLQYDLGLPEIMEIAAILRGGTEFDSHSQIMRPRLKFHLQLSVASELARTFAKSPRLRRTRGESARSISMLQRWQQSLTYRS